MSIFSAFSRGPRSADRDGRWLVYCSSCKEPICMTSMQLGKVVCELCRRVENGEPLTAEAIRQYRESKMGVMGVTMINVPPPEDRAPQLNPVRSMGNGFMRALGFNKTSEPTQAEIVVQEKQRGRLFEEVDLEKTLGDGESLGTMQELNQIFEENDRDQR